MTQIRVYDDNINVWNDGTLPAGISSEALKRPHRSNPRNPIIADVCFKGGLIDSWGSGTIKIIDTCKQAELPEPELLEQEGGFSVTLFKNKLTVEQLTKLGLNERQLKAVEYVKEKGKITNKEYQELFKVARMTATRDLTELVDKAVFKSSEVKGAGSFYELL
ncbi:MAG: ATP-binding protein [Sphingobacterium sp.]